MKPKILISGNKKLENYIAAIEGVGGIATAKYLPDIDTGFDGLVLCGGNDTNPAYYGEEVNGARDFDSLRDDCEFALADAFVKAGKPILGICRGCQLLNIYFGGTLYQNIENADKHCSFSDYDLVHKVNAVSGVFIEKLYGESFAVNSYHHQAVKKLGDGLEIAAYSADGTVTEGFWHKNLPIIAVQWHPERMCFANKRDDTVDGSKIFEYFLKLCKDVENEKTFL